MTRMWVVLLASASMNLAQAGWYEELNKATELLKVVSDAMPTSPTTTAEGSKQPQQGKTLPDVSNDPGAMLREPLGLTPLPNAELVKRHDDVLDRVRMPLSVPERSSNGYAARYSVPMEGRVTVLQYRYRAGESPLRLYRHHAQQLEARGMEQLFACDTDAGKKCGEHYGWSRLLNPDNRLDPGYLPYYSSQYVAYLDQNGALALIGTGRNDNNDPVALVYVVEGKVLDANAVEQARVGNAGRPVAAVTPAPKTAGGSKPATTSAKTAPAETAAATFKQVAAADLSSLVARSRGTLVVQLTSDDLACTYCVTGNPHFEQLSELYAGKAQFIRATWSPWSSFANDPFVKAHRVSGVPAVLTFVNGKRVSKLEGDQHHEDLYAEGLKPYIR